jgi:(p)ppGpp synthase/HD superfamily hydrolase
MKGEMISGMLLLATTQHNGQYDMGGTPYILHPLKVMYYLKTDDEELQCIAVGHDLIEDTTTTYADLETLGFTKRIIDGIRALTNLPGETNQDKLERICSNRDAMRVKLCDLRHNSDIRRLKDKVVSEKDIKRIQKYHWMWLEITKRLNNVS